MVIKAFPHTEIINYSRFKLANNLPYPRQIYNHYFWAKMFSNILPMLVFFAVKMPVLRKVAFW